MFEEVFKLYFLFLLDILGITFLIEILFVQFVFIMHKSYNTCSNPWIFQPSFSKILYEQKNSKVCVAANQQTASAATLNAQLEVVFKDTSWPKILHVKTEFHLTFLHGQTVSRLLMEKKVGMFLKTKIGYYIEKFPKIAVKHFCMPSSFCPLEVTFLKIANVIYCRCFFLCVPFWCWTTCDFLFSAK